MEIALAFEVIATHAPQASGGELNVSYGSEATDPVRRDGPPMNRNPLKADVISVRKPAPRRVNQTGGSDDPKLIAEVMLAGT
jgi:hypothetical protein